MADGEWTWGDPGMPRHLKKLGSDLRIKARVAQREIDGIVRQTPLSGLFCTITEVRQEMEALAPGDRAAFVAQRYAALRASDVAFLRQLAPHMTGAQTDLLAPHISGMMARISTIQGARALNSMLTYPYPNTAARQELVRRPRVRFRDAVLGFDNVINQNGEGFWQLFGRQRSIDITRHWPGPIYVIDPTEGPVGAPSEPAQAIH